MSQAQVFRLEPFGGVVLSGQGPPSSTLGVEGNLYLDKENILLYGPKTSAGWGAGLNIRAATRFTNSLVLKGSLRHDAPMPTTPTDGDLYIFSSEGVCTWLANQTVRIYDLALYNNNNWTHLKCGQNSLNFKGRVDYNTTAPTNPKEGDFYLFQSKGLCAWTVPSQEVSIGTLALYLNGGWQFNISAPAWTLNPPSFLRYLGTQVGNQAPTSNQMATMVQLGAGSLHSSWTSGWQGGATQPELTKPSIAVYTDQGWVTLEPLLEPASEQVAGKLKLASQVEVNTGTNTEKAVTPKTFRDYTPPTALGMGQSRIAKIFTNTYNLVANTWQPVIHNLNNNYPNITVYQNNEVILLDMERVDANSIRLRSAVNLNDVTVTLVG